MTGSKSKTQAVMVQTVTTAATTSNWRNKLDEESFKLLKGLIMPFRHSSARRGKWKQLNLAEDIELRCLPHRIDRRVRKHTYSDGRASLVRDMAITPAADGSGERILLPKGMAVEVMCDDESSLLLFVSNFERDGKQVELSIYRDGRVIFQAYRAASFQPGDLDP